MKKKTELDPKQVEFFKNYLDIESETLVNAYQSAKKKGYSDNY